MGYNGSCPIYVNRIEVGRVVPVDERHTPELPLTKHQSTHCPGNHDWRWSDWIGCWKHHKQSDLSKMSGRKHPNSQHLDALSNRSSLGRIDCGFTSKYEEFLLEKWCLLKENICGTISWSCRSLCTLNRTGNYKTKVIGMNIVSVRLNNYCNLYKLKLVTRSRRGESRFSACTCRHLPNAWFR